MLKRNISYKDLNGDNQTDLVYFNLTKSELTKMEMRDSIVDTKGEKVTGGLKERIERVLAEGNGSKIIDLLEYVIKESYGERSEDGKKFYKDANRSHEFMNSMAYDTLFWELATDAGAAVDFIKKIMPDDLDSPTTSVAPPAAPERTTGSVQATPVTPGSFGVIDQANDPHPAELTPLERETLEKLQARQNMQ